MLCLKICIYFTYLNLTKILGNMEKVHLKDKICSWKWQFVWKMTIICFIWKSFLLNDQPRKLANKPIPFFHYFYWMLGWKKTNKTVTNWKDRRGKENRGPTMAHGVIKKWKTLISSNKFKIILYTSGPWKYNAQQYRIDSGLNSDLLKIIKVPNNKKHLEFSNRFSHS